MRPAPQQNTNDRCESPLPFPSLPSSVVRPGVLQRSAATKPVTATIVISINILYFADPGLLFCTRNGHSGYVRNPPTQVYRPNIKFTAIALKVGSCAFQSLGFTSPLVTSLTPPIESGNQRLARFQSLQTSSPISFSGTGCGHQSSDRRRGNLPLDNGP